MASDGDYCSFQYQFFVGFISSAIGLPVGILLAVALCHRGRLLRCMLSFPSSYVSIGLTSRVLRHVSTESALRAYCVF